MEIDDMHEWYNRRAREIWVDHAEKLSDLPGMSFFPIQRPAFNVNPDLVMVGMNPSFIARLRNLRGHRLRWRANVSEDLLAQFVVEEGEARQNYKVFYGPLDRFAASAGSGRSEHLDLLPLRHTSQSDVLNRHWDHHGDPNEFVEACLDLFKEALRRMAPKAVVVANAAASRQLIKLLPLEQVARGRFHRWGEMPNTSIFLSGMLSGQRALDEFSRDRLAADVRSVLKPQEDPQVA